MAAKTYDYIVTNSGLQIGHPAGVTSRQILLHDIIHALSMQTRYNGHLDTFYSVAEHSVLVSLIASSMGDNEAVLPALFHDAHEAYMGDIAAPQKGMIEGATEFERMFERKVRGALLLPGEGHPVWQRVRQYDTWIMHRELRELTDPVFAWQDPSLDALVDPRILPVGLSPSEAYKMMRDRALELGVSREKLAKPTRLG